VTGVFLDDPVLVSPVTDVFLGDPVLYVFWVYLDLSLKFQCLVCEA
jgi:hypothetical protein